MLYSDRMIRLFTEKNTEVYSRIFQHMDHKQSGKCLLIMVFHIYYCSLYIDYCFIYGTYTCIIIKHTNVNLKGYS